MLYTAEASRHVADPFALAAVVGMPVVTVKQHVVDHCEAHPKSHLALSVINGSSSCVLSGTEWSIAEVRTRLRHLASHDARDARRTRVRVVPLYGSIPFHTPLLAPCEVFLSRITVALESWGAHVLDVSERPLSRRLPCATLDLAYGSFPNHRDNAAADGNDLGSEVNRMWSTLVAQTSRVIDFGILVRSVKEQHLGRGAHDGCGEIGPSSAQADATIVCIGAAARPLATMIEHAWVGIMKDHQRKGLVTLPITSVEDVTQVAAALCRSR